MQHTARYNRWHQTDRNDYTQDWEPDQQSAWSSDAKQVPQQYNKHPSTQNQENNEKRIPQHYNLTQNRGNNDERTPQQYSNPLPLPVEYAPEWYLPHRNTLSGSQSTSENNHTVIGNRQDLYYDQVQYPSRIDEKVFKDVGDVYGYNRVPVNDGTYQVPQQAGSSIQDLDLKKAQQELQKIIRRKLSHPSKYDIIRAHKRKHLEARFAKQARWQSGTQTKEDIAVRERRLAKKKMSKAERLAAMTPAERKQKEAQLRVKEMRLMRLREEQRKAIEIRRMKRKAACKDSSTQIK